VFDKKKAVADGSFRAILPVVVRGCEMSGRVSNIDVRFLSDF